MKVAEQSRRTLILAFALNSEIERGSRKKQEGESACRGKRFPWKIESTAWYASADEKVVRERLHNRHSPATFPRAAGEVQKSAQFCQRAGTSWAGLIYYDGACCAGQLSGPGGRKTRSVIYREDQGIGEVGRLPIEEPAIQGRFSAVICLFKFSGHPTFHRVAFVLCLENRTRLTHRRLLLLFYLLFLNSQGNYMHIIMFIYTSQCLCSRKGKSNKKIINF